MHLSNCVGVDHCSCDEIRRYAIVLVLAFFVSVSELILASISGSMALSADALHTGIVDGGASVAAIVGAWHAQRVDGNGKRIVKLAAFAQAILLLSAAVVIGLASIQRLRDPPQIQSLIVMWTAGIVACCNTLQHHVLGHSHESVRMRAQRRHVIGDAAISVAVFIGGALMWMFEWWWADPALSLAAAALFLVWSVATFYELRSL